jgi:hypothetical protein
LHFTNSVIALKIVMSEMLSKEAQEAETRCKPQACHKKNWASFSWCISGFCVLHLQHKQLLAQRCKSPATLFCPPTSTLLLGSLLPICSGLAGIAHRSTWSYTPCFWIVE